MKTQERNKLIDERREKEKLRKRAYREKISGKPAHSLEISPRAYGSNQSYSRATMRVKKVFPKSPRKQAAVIRNMVNDLERHGEPWAKSSQ